MTSEIKTGRNGSPIVDAHAEESRKMNLFPGCKAETTTTVNLFVPSMKFIIGLGRLDGLVYSIVVSARLVQVARDSRLEVLLCDILPLHILGQKHEMVFPYSL